MPRKHGLPKHHRSPEMADDAVFKFQIDISQS